ncbi:maleylpyruvate isomerase N-terminal domain-containing protein [Nocardia colli]
MNVRRLLADERPDLVSLLRTLSADEWESPSLCAGWRVRDVAGHLLYDAVSLPSSSPASPVPGSRRIASMLDWWSRPEPCRRRRLWIGSNQREVIRPSRRGTPWPTPSCTIKASVGRWIATASSPQTGRSAC